MFTEKDRRKKNWRSQKRALRKAMNKRDRLMKKFSRGKYDNKDLAKLKSEITDAKVLVSTLELRVGDRPE